MNPLTCFLLQRALDCPTLIGVRLCWHLRSQLDNPDARLRFSLILDALCRGFGPQLLLFVHGQVNALHRLTDLAISVKVRRLVSFTSLDVVQNLRVELVLSRAQPAASDPFYHKFNDTCVARIHCSLGRIADAYAMSELYLMTFTSKLGEPEGY